VCDRASKGFTVRAKASKTARGEFSYRVIAKRKDVAGSRFEKVASGSEFEKRAPKENREM